MAQVSARLSLYIYDRPDRRIVWNPIGEPASRCAMKRLTAKYLDPASRLGEILFGMIMILTVTLTAGLKVSDGKAGVRQLLFAAVGSNVAWGLIDAVMYIVNSMIVRRGKIRLVEGELALRWSEVRADR